MDFPCDHSKNYRGYGKNRKNTREKKVNMYPKKSKCVQRMRDRDNKYAMLNITNNYDTPQKMTNNCQNLKYARKIYYKGIDDYFNILFEELIELEMEREQMYRNEEDEIASAYDYSYDTSLRKRSYSDENIWFSDYSEPEIKKHHDSSNNRTCPNCGYEF